MKELGTLHSDDIFEMPKVSIKHERNVFQLDGVKLANSEFKQYHFSKILEMIELQLDEKGAKVENTAIIQCKRKKIKK